MVTSRRDNYHAHFPIKFYLQFEGQLANVWERWPQHTPMSGPLRSQYCLLRAGSWASLVACKGHAQTVRARYLVGGREQVRQAGTQKKAPVRRRGPHAVRRRSREQVNRTPEGETETTWQECRGADKSGGLFKQSPSTRCYHWTTAASNAQCGPPGGSGELAPREFGLVAERSQGIPVLTLALFLASSGLNGCVY